MYARKSIQQQALARYRRATLTSVAILSIVLTSACVSATQRENSEKTSSPVNISEPATVSEEAAVKSTQTEDTSIAGRNILKLKAQGIQIGKTQKVKGGSYPQYEVEESSHLARFNRSTYQDDGQQEVSDAKAAKYQLAAANYMMNFALDNPTVNDFDANKKEFSQTVARYTMPEYREELRTSVLNENTTSFANNTFDPRYYAGDNAKGFSFVTDGKTPRIADVSGLSVISSQPWEGGMYFEYEGTYVTNIVDKNNKAYTMDKYAKYGITLKSHKNELLMEGINFIEGKYAKPVPVK